MDDYVSKPLKPKLLMQTINKCIHNINQLKELSKQNNNNRTSDFAKNLKKGAIKSGSGTLLSSLGNSPTSGSSKSAVTPNRNGYSTSASSLDLSRTGSPVRSHSNDHIPSRPGALAQGKRSATETSLSCITNSDDKITEITGDSGDQDGKEVSDF